MSITVRMRVRKEIQEVDIKTANAEGNGRKWSAGKAPEFKHIYHLNISSPHIDWSSGGELTKISYPR